MEGDDEIILVAMQAGHRRWYERWLAHNGLMLGRIPDGDVDGIPTYLVTPREWPQSDVPRPPDE